MENNLENLLLKNRSYRKYLQTQISYATFKDLIGYARLCASSANKQSLRFAFAEKENAQTVFDNIRWAGSIKDGTPQKEFRPPCYIIVLNDNTSAKVDLISVGIAVQSILLAATEKGIGGCIFASVNIPKLHSALNLENNIEIVCVLSLGIPNETVEIKDITKASDTKYWREDGVHYVPKIITDDLIIKL